VGVSATEKNRTIAIDEELRITGVSVSEENQRVLNGGVSVSWMNDEGLLANGVSATEEAKQLLDGIASSMMEDEKDRGLPRKGVSATKRIVETSAGRSCFGNGKMAGVEGMKNAGQWCFSIEKTDERLLTTVFQQREENERLLVFQQREKLLRTVL
jgi:hypothetical protein